MESFIIYIDYNLWVSITDGPHVPAEASTDLPKKELDEIIEKNKRAKGVDMRAYSLIQMSIPNEICVQVVAACQLLYQ